MTRPSNRRSLRFDNLESRELLSGSDEAPAEAPAADEVVADAATEAPAEAAADADAEQA